MRLLMRRLFRVLFYAYLAAFFCALVLTRVQSQYAHSLAVNVILRSVFLFVGSILLGIPVVAFGEGSITVGKGRRRTFTRRERPFDFWGYSFLFLFFGLGASVLGILSLLSLVVHGPW